MSFACTSRSTTLFSAHVPSQERDQFQVFRSCSFRNANEKNEPNRHFAEGDRLGTVARP